MEITEIFTKKNIEILKLLSKESLHIRDIAKQLGISPAKVHSTIQLFKKNSLIKENKEKNKKRSLQTMHRKKKRAYRGF